MARMYNMANDWTYDLFAEDANLYKATPMKGVNCRRNASDREKFMTWFKNCVRDFTAEWNKDHKGLYDRYDGWVGDAFARELSDMCFSDYYKDTYGQRPHLDAWYYIHLTGLPQNSDVGRTFCADPVGRATDNAKEYREHLMAM